MKRKQLGVAMGEREMDALRRLAELEGLSLAATVRRLIRLEAMDRGFWVPLGGRTETKEGLGHGRSN